MGQIFVAQTNLKFVVSVDQNITGAITTKIKYIKPNGDTGEWVATITNATTGEITYIVAAANILDQYGTWILWAYIVFSNGTIAAGEPFDQIVFEEGNEC